MFAEEYKPPSWPITAKVNSTLQSSLRAFAPVNESQNDAQNDGHFSSRNKQEGEALPTPQSSYWRPSGQGPPYSVEPLKELYTSPALQGDDHRMGNIHQRFASTPTNEDYFYRNKKGEWIYVVPEHDFDHVYELGYTFDDGRNYGNSRNYLAQREPITYSERRLPHQRPRFKPIKPGHRRISPEPVPFLTKLFNTGNGFLSMLNPLSYLVQQNPPSPNVRLQLRPNIGYRKKPYVSHFQSYNKRPSFTTHPESLLSHFTHDYSDNNNNPSEQISRDNADYKYQDYSYVDNYYDYKDGLIASDFDADFKDGNYFDQANIEKDHNLTESTLNPLVYGSETITKEFTKSTEQNDTYSNQDYIYKSLGEKTDKEDKKDYNLNYDNIYKFLDLETVHDPEALENIRKVDDKYTLEYLKQNRLRDDLYIGKDGNIYLKEKIPLQQSGDGFQPYHIESLSQPRGSIEGKKQSRPNQKRFPAYTTLNRKRQNRVHSSYT